MAPNLTTALVDHLRGCIVDGRIAPGEKLPSENALIAEHGVSRTVVREAITRLQAEGLVHTRRGSGSFALTPPAEAQEQAPRRQARTVDERRALLEFRAAVESEAAALGAVRRTPGQLAAMETALENFDAAGGNPAAALACDFAFHLAVAESAGNAYLLDAVRGLGPSMISMPRSRLAPEAAGLTASSPVSVEHRAIYEAVASGDALAAAAAMRVHLAGSRRRLEAEAGVSSAPTG